MTTWRVFVGEAAVLLQIVLLTAMLLFIVVAARGYRGTAWGRVLRPVPVGVAGFLASVGVQVFSGTGLPVHLLSLLAWIPAVGAVALSAYRLVTMVSERGRL